MSKEYITKYRIVNNPSYNDFNDELPYTIVAVDYDPKTDLIRQKGFNGWSKIGDKLYDTRQECEKHFVFEINYELDNNVADLQHRLEVANKMGRDAEKENQQLKALLKATEVTDIHNELADLQINNEWLESENQQLKQQLAEKDEELAYITKQAKKFNNEAQKYFEDAYCNDFHNQDKISFAIAELEKVKGKALHFYVNDTPELTSFYVDVKEIDNQIKRLTHQREDKGEIK